MILPVRKRIQEKKNFLVSYRMLTAGMLKALRLLHKVSMLALVI